MTGKEGLLFSLIVPTLNRCEDVRRLLVSIEAQTCRDFEIILVDQNPDDLLGEICRDFAGRMPLLHLKVDFKGAARARNHGLGFAKGSILNFPDDDCEFAPDVLARVAAILRESPGKDAVFARAVDPKTKESSVTKFATGSRWVTAANLYHTTVEFTMFARRTLFDEVGLLDENLGVGTFFGAEEGADFVLRAVYLGKRLHYDPALLIYHVQKVQRFDAKERSRAYNYGKGFGRLSVKHLRLYRQPHAALRFLVFQARAAVAVLLFLLLLKPERCRYYLKLIQGRFVGVFRSWGEFRRSGSAVVHGS
ncbi:MAG: glycosyltransferase family A protein [Chthoniobacteraceae bacterium]